MLLTTVKKPSAQKAPEKGRQHQERSSIPTSPVTRLRGWASAGPRSGVVIPPGSIQGGNVTGDRRAAHDDRNPR